MATEATYIAAVKSRNELNALMDQHFEDEPSQYDPVWDNALRVINRRWDAACAIIDDYETQNICPCNF